MVGQRQKELDVVIGTIAEEIEMHQQNIADIEIDFYAGTAIPLLRQLSAVVPELSSFAVQMENNRKLCEGYRLRRTAAGCMWKRQSELFGGKNNQSRWRVKRST
jgi:hypothetical protein